MRKVVMVACFASLLAFASSASAVVLSNVPAYNWYHGCTATAVGSVMGYWDVHGYPNMFTASGWDAVKLTSNVQDQISSPAHNAKYDPTPDDASLPVPAKTSVADYLGTSVDPLGYGSTYTSNIIYGMTGYASYRGYASTATNYNYILGLFGLTWSTLKNEINAGRPMVFNVDSDGNGTNDHSVPVIGYQTVNGVNYYGCYTTWTEDETIQWYQFRGMSSSYAWGISCGESFKVTSAASSYSLAASSVSGGASVASPVPEPCSFFLLGTGVMALIFVGKRFRK
jgi:hypothetical protein